MGSVHAAGWAACADADLVAVTSSPDRPPSDLAQQYGMRACATLEELLDLVDVVDICAPTDLHHEITLAAAAAGRAVICEKPLARTPGQATEMIDACREAGVPLLVAHVVRFFPEYAAAKAAVDNGEIGDPAVVRLTRATFQPAKPAGNWFVDERRSGGLHLDLMIHDLDYARWVAGDVVTAYARSVLATRPEAGVDHVLAILRHRSGAISHVEGSWAYPPPTFRTRGEIAGTTGTLEFDSDRTAPVRPVLRSRAEAGDVGTAQRVAAQYVVHALHDGVAEADVAVDVEGGGHHRQVVEDRVGGAPGEHAAGR
jgi:predicted dehydrogenase